MGEAGMDMIIDFFKEMLGEQSTIKFLSDGRTEIMRLKKEQRKSSLNGELFISGATQIWILS